MEPVYTHGQVKRVVTGIMLCVFLSALDQTVVIPAVPAIAGDLDAFSHLPWIVTAYLLTSTAATPIYGKLSDIYGRRALLLPALALFIVASMLCGFAQTLPQLIGARALQGLGGAGLLSMAQAAVSDVVSPRERGRYQGYLASMWGVASIAGPLVGGYVTDTLSWRWVFWANLPVGLLAMWLCDRALRPMPVQRRTSRIDGEGAALLAFGVTALLLMLSWGGTQYPWDSAPVLGAGALGCVVLAALVWQERRAADPILPPHLFGDPTFLRGVSIAFFTSLGLFGATFLLPLYFQLVLGLDAGASGVLIVPFLLSTVVGAYTGGQSARRIGRTRTIVVVALACAVAGFWGMAAMTGTAGLWAVLPCTVLLGAGIGATMPSVLMQVQNAAARRDVGAATGSMLFLRSMGGAFGSTIVGALLVSQFNVGLQAAGMPDVDLGALRRGADGLGGLGNLQSARDALTSGFKLAFAVCAVLLSVAIVIAVGMRDLQLRSTNAAH
ncbi:MAG: MFS transporter [Gemmatimonadaceae bacterium]|nr:MFS transporter [Acetobacteraceae bacterium]